MSPSPGANERTFSILAIDDDPHILSQIHHVLGQENYEVLTAVSGRAGLNLFQRHAPDLVLVDANLGDSDGLELLTHMKERRRYVPVIVLASVLEAAAVASLRRGADDYISKPITPEELLERVRRNLEKGRQGRAKLQLAEQLQQQLAVLLPMREVARKATHTADLYDLLQGTLDELLTAMRLDAGVILISGEGELVPVANRGLPQSIASALTRRRLAWNDPALRPFREIDEAVLTRGEEQEGGPLSIAVGYKFTAVVPLWAHARLWGLLEVAAKEERPHPEQDLEMLTTAGQQIALALANARLQETAALRVRELALLNEACLALTSDLDLEQILTTVMLRTSDVIGVETGSLLLADEDSGELIFRITLGGEANRILSQRIPPGEGIAGWVFAHGRPLLIPDVRQDERFYPEIDRYIGFETRSVLSVPLLLRDRPIGVIELINKIDGEFTDSDQRLLESVAALTATAIEQSRLNEWTTSFILVDPLTRLPNHRFLTGVLEREAARCRRYGRVCSVLLMGVDRRLHLPEPRWRALAAVVHKALRQSDLLCRHRDGPLALVLPETGEEGARTLSQRLRADIRRSGLQEPAGVDLVEHIRFGQATYPESVDDPLGLLQEAERALVRAWQDKDTED